MLVSNSFAVLSTQYSVLTPDQTHIVLVVFTQEKPKIESDNLLLKPIDSCSLSLSKYKQ